MRTCSYCKLPIPDDVDDVYCTRQCFDSHIDEALKRDAARCKILTRIISLRDDAEKRVHNIESFGPDKLLKTKEYFQSRADVLNDLLMVMDPTSPCSCC